MPIISANALLRRVLQTTTNETRPASPPQTQPQPAATGSNVFVPATGTAPSRFTAAQTTAAAELLKAAGGNAAEAGPLLAANPQLAARLERYTNLLVTSSPAQRQSVAMRALRSAVMDGSAPLPAQLSKMGATKLLNDYAKDLGLAAPKTEQGRVTVMVEGKRHDLGAVGAPLADLGRAMAFARYGVDGIVPPHSPVVRDGSEFNVANAHLATHLSEIAYGDEAAVRTQLEAMGFDMRTFTWINDARTDTQGFVVANKDGDLFTNFRGTASKTDVATDANFIRTRPSWVDETITVHGGFSKALDSVWPQVEAGIKKAQAVTGRDAPMMVTGHSLGGALAQLAALRAVKAGLVDGGQTQVYTIGSPRVGNNAFAEQIENEVRGNFRIVNFRDTTLDQQDMVTQVPPKYLGYRHGGTLIRLDQEGFLVISKKDSRAEMGEPGAAPDDSEPIPANAKIEAMTEEQIRELILSQNVDEGSAQSQQNGFGGMMESALPNVFFHSSLEYLERVSGATLRGNPTQQQAADGLWR